MRHPSKPHLLIAAALAALLALMTVAPAAASARSPITIEVLTDIESAANDVDPSSDLCPTGSVTNAFVNFVGDRSNRHAQILIAKHFECADGTFDILLRVRLDFATGATEGTWSVLGGTGDFEDMHGTGTLVGIPQAEGVILDIYTGSVHFD